MKLQNLTVIFIIIIIPVILLVSLYISTGLKTIKYQSLYDNGLLTATHDAIYAFELNTSNNQLSNNPEVKRDILKSSIKMFEKSLCNACGISSYSTDEIEEYIPAIVFCMYDGFYMYAPSGIYNSATGKIENYDHNLKNYVYYSEVLDDEGTTIIYSLDNYITVTGMFKNSEGIKEYQVKSGYLINPNDWNSSIKQYKDVFITKEYINGVENSDALNYYKEAYEFSKWFLNESGLKNIQIDGKKPFDISSSDPEDESSNFVQHKRKVIKNKLESVLNSSITAYSERSRETTFKMPKFTEEDWQKIYSNISMITFFQGRKIGLIKYTGYCVLNSTNSNEYVNSNLMYFTDEDGYYHDIRCTECNSATNLTGYKIGSFEKVKLQMLTNNDGTPKKNAEGKILYDDSGTQTTSPYKYNHSELACYKCINGQISTTKSAYEYVDDLNEINPEQHRIKKAYYTSLARERYNQIKLLKTEN